MKLAAIFLTVGIALSTGAASAESLSIELRPGASNPPSPQMGDRLVFHTVIRNDGTAPTDGLIAWISLVQIDKGKEQPVDLEDWSAHKAVAAASLPPGQALEADWPMRLIQVGTYRVLVSAVSRESTGLVASPFVDFTVRPKPVVESQRVLPIAFGLPMLIAGLMLWRLRRRASTSPHPLRLPPS